jgi:hypothetical protein
MNHAECFLFVAENESLPSALGGAACRDPRVRAGRGKPLLQISAHDNAIAENERTK